MTGLRMIAPGSRYLEQPQLHMCGMPLIMDYPAVWPCPEAAVLWRMFSLQSPLVIIGELLYPPPAHLAQGTSLA